MSFDIETTGFSIAEIDVLIEQDKPEEDSDPRDDLLPFNVLKRVQFGDIWQLGNHRLSCGDSLNPVTVAQLMGDKKAIMVFTDPSYNVKVDGHVGGKGKVRHAEFSMVSGEMSQGEFTQFLRTAMENLTAHAIDGSIHFICMDWRHMSEVTRAAEKTGRHARLCEFSPHYCDIILTRCEIYAKDTAVPIHSKETNRDTT